MVFQVRWHVDFSFPPSALSAELPHPDLDMGFLGEPEIKTQHSNLLIYGYLNPSLSANRQVIPWCKNAICIPMALLDNH